MKDISHSPVLMLPKGNTTLDVYVTNEHSFSGNNSIKFDSDNSTSDNLPVS